MIGYCNVLDETPGFVYPIFRSDDGALYFQNADAEDVIRSFERIDQDYFDSGYHLIPIDSRLRRQRGSQAVYVFEKSRGHVIYGTRNTIAKDLKYYLFENVDTLERKHPQVTDEILEILSEEDPHEHVDDDDDDDFSWIRNMALAAASKHAERMPAMVKKRVSG